MIAARTNAEKKKDAFLQGRFFSDFSFAVLNFERLFLKGEGLFLFGCLDLSSVLEKRIFLFPGIFFLGSFA